MKKEIFTQVKKWLIIKRIGLTMFIVFCSLVTSAHEPFKVKYTVVEQTVEIDTAKTNLSRGDVSRIVRDKKCVLVKQVLTEKSIKDSTEVIADSGFDAKNELTYSLKDKYIPFEKSDSSSTNPIYIVRRYDIESAIAVQE